MNGEADTGIYESLSLMFEGDSGSFIFPGEGLKPLNVVNTNRWVRAEIRLDRVISKAQWDVETAHPELLPDFASQEEERLSAFLDSVKQKESVIPLTGMYMFLENKGSGKRIKKGSEVLLTYKGYFLSGEKFDDTDTHKEPFMFTMGDQGQVIKGFEIGLSSLRGGDEAVFIIPSSLAFAETGSSTGIVPPYTAVVYKLKVQNVR
jgi:FKBP-type peptidyl-prolyl cis-trans isomerase